MNKNFYRLNRQNLISSLPYEKCMVVLSSGYEINRSADENYEFQVNNNFYYLTGIKQPNVHLIMLKENDRHIEILYIDEYDELYEKWMGHRLTYIEASDISGIYRSNVSYISNYEDDLLEFIEEYKVVSERYEFLTKQRDDLITAQKDLTDIITDMTKVMRKEFEERFYQIAKYFKTTFTELFGGGTAALTLEDPDNILESNINIDVQPPGKKLKNLSLLSGGERALSAIALLFAILKTRPKPFCFLDENEAALDDVNVYRFADYIRRYSQNTQFIVVTHRRGTMESADVIYGVTMQEKGVSKLLELHLDEITE
jgi:chromosome segregation protein